MAEYYRSHTATRPVILVIGSPEPQRHGKPPRYPSTQREHWRPQRAIPVKQRKAERMIEFIRRVQKQDNEVRDFMWRAGAST